MVTTEIKKNTKTVKTSQVKEVVSAEAVIYGQNGKESGKIQLPESIFGLKWNADLVHQVVTSMLSSARDPIAHTKNRGEVSGGGKKPWRQKGTGRARHGSTRSPIWVGGGVTHGPRNDKSYDRKINKKMKAKALYTILSAKYKNGQIIFVDDITFRQPKTKEAKNTLVSLSKISGFGDLATKKRNSAYLVFSKKDLATEKSFNNIDTIKVDEIRNINPVDLMKYKYVVIENPKAGLPQIEGKMTK